MLPHPYTFYLVPFTFLIGFFRNPSMTCLIPMIGLVNNILGPILRMTLRIVSRFSGL